MAAAASISGKAWWCGACGYVSRAPGICPTCGGRRGKALRGGVVELPGGTVPCSRCGTQEAPIVFRGWSRLYAYFIGARETRSSAYLCVECARRETAVSLTFTALLGWWALQSIFWHAPRSTYFNWRSVWAPPRDPLSWGAIRLEELLASIAAEEEEPAAEETAAPADSPLFHLSETERHLVRNAPDLYGALRIGGDAGEKEVKAAWRDQAKANHPDLNPGDAEAVARMLAVNQAYEILGNPRLRAAYDWLTAKEKGAP
jgi:hypothetical protein